MKVQSSMISEISDWTEVNGQGQFDVTFPNGKTYRYFNVPKGIYQKLISADSIGRFFDIFIKKAGYKYMEVTVTGRLDSGPNLQNIFNHTEIGREIIKTLQRIAECSTDPVARADANTVFNKIKNLL